MISAILKILRSVKKYIFNLASLFLNVLNQSVFKIRLFKKKGIRFQFLASILFSAILIYLLIGFYLLNRIKQETIISAKAIADSYSREYANLMTAELNAYLNQTIGLAQVVESNLKLPSVTRSIIYKNSLKNNIDNAQDILAVWLNIQVSSYDSTWKNDFGRRRYTFFRVGNESGFQEDFLDMNGNNTSGDYYKIRQKGTIEFSEPYYDTYGHDSSKYHLMTSICVPLFDGQKSFVGLAGVDLDLQKLEPYAKKLNIFENCFSMIISSGGTIVIHPDTSKNGKPLHSFYKEDDFTYKITENIKNGKTLSFEGSEGKEKYYFTFAPINLSHLGNPWSLAVAVPMKSIYSSSNRAIVFSVLVALFGLAVLLLITYKLTDNLVKPLELTTHLEVVRQDELGQLAEALDSMSNKLKEMVNSISSGSELLTKTAKSLSGSSKQLLTA
jgi:methyl-accepting chemotaxis protein